MTFCDTNCNNNYSLINKGIGIILADILYIYSCMYVYVCII